MNYAAYIPKYFTPQELCPPEFVNHWMYICDGAMLRILDRLRERFGRIVINNYGFGGTVKYAGVRPLDCKIGSKFSQHKYGRAFDLKFLDQKDLEEVITFIEVECPVIRVIRKYPMWGLHLDNRNIAASKPIIWRAAV